MSTHVNAFVAEVDEAHEKLMNAVQGYKAKVDALVARAREDEPAPETEAVSSGEDTFQQPVDEPAAKKSAAKKVEVK